MKILEKHGLAADHAGFELKEYIKDYLREKGITTVDYGTSTAESMDYPDVIHPLAKAINSGELSRGIIICGSGNGVSMTANKYNHVRAALCWTKELAELARLHNDANILALPARFIEKEKALQLLDVFLNTEFEGGRHQRRVEKIKKN